MRGCQPGLLHAVAALLLVAAVTSAQQPEAAAAAAADTAADAAAAVPAHGSSTGASCATALSRVSCYYSARKDSIVGLWLTPRGGGRGWGACSTSGGAASIVRVRIGAGITAVDVTYASTSRAVVKMVFTMSDGSSSTCVARGFYSGRRLLQQEEDAAASEAPTEAPAAAVAAAAAVSSDAAAPDDAGGANDTAVAGARGSTRTVRITSTLQGGQSQWVGSLFSSCMRRGNRRGYLAAPVDACWAAAGPVPAVPSPQPPHGTVLYHSISGSTIAGATVTNAVLSSAGVLSGGRVTAGSITSGTSNAGAQLHSGTVRSGRVVAASYSGGSWSGSTLVGVQLAAASLSSVLVESAAQGSPSPVEPSPQPAAPSPSPVLVLPSPSPVPAAPSPSPVPAAPSPSPRPLVVPSPSPQPLVVPSPSPQPLVVPSPSPRPLVVPSPSPQPLVVPSPSPAPAVVPSPSPALVGPANSLTVSLFARGKSSCGALSANAAASLTSYLNSQLVMLQLASYSVTLDAGSCQCSLDPSTGVPHWGCAFTVAGPSSAALDTSDVATYLASTVSAAGQEFCAAQPDASGFCDASLGITGFCAAHPASGASYCRLAQSNGDWSMLTTLASPGKDCVAKRVLSADAQSSLVAYVATLVPGFTVSLPKPTSALQCVQQWGNAYYAVEVGMTAGALLDTQGAAEFAAAQLTATQLQPCINGTSGADAAPAFCAEFAGPALCADRTYVYAADGFNVPQCSGAGASVAVNVLNPETCTAGTPPASYAAGLDAWWADQMPIVTGTRYKNVVARASTSDATQKPGAVSGSAQPYCKYVYRMHVTGPLVYDAATLNELGVAMLSNAMGLNTDYADVTCDAYSGTLALCAYWAKAKMCYGYPWAETQPYTCSFEA